MTWRSTDTSRSSAAVKQRLIGIDTARALALFGMMIAHTGFIAAEQGWIANTLVTISDERSRLLFAICAGLGLGLLTGGVRPPGKLAAKPIPAGGDAGAIKHYSGAPRVDAPSRTPHTSQSGHTPQAKPSADPRFPYRLQIVIRAAILFIIGIILTSLGPMVHVILDEYGIAFLLAAPLVFLQPWLLLTLGIVVIPTLSLLTVWAIDSGRLAPEGIVEVFADILFTGVYPVSTWLAVLLIGVALVRLDLARLRTSLTTLIISSAAAATLLPLAHFFGRQPGTGSFGWTESGAPWQSAPGLIPPEIAIHAAEFSETLGNIALGFALVSALLLITLHTPQAFATTLAVLLRPITVTGSMPLTIYTLHVVALVIIVALDPGGVGIHKSWLTTWLMIGGAIVFANLWGWLLGQGPLERLLSVVSDRRFFSTAPAHNAVE